MNPVARGTLQRQKFRQSAYGFTLIEVLIALAITAFVSAIAYSGLSAVISGVESPRTAHVRVDEAIIGLQVALEPRNCLSPLMSRNVPKMSYVVFNLLDCQVRNVFLVPQRPLSTGLSA